MDTILSRMMQWFHPTAEVPEEEECHRQACSLRQSKADELRSKLQTDPDLEKKLNDISNLLHEVK